MAKIGPTEAVTRDYRERNRTLARLKLGSYPKYLKSPRWREIKRRVLKAEPDCRACGGEATTVHHASYSEAALKGEDTADLWSLCGACHEDAEFTRDGNGVRVKRTLSGANERIRSRQAQHRGFITE